MLSLLRPSIVMLVALTLLTGVAYPLAMTGIAQTLFPDQASGSLVRVDGKIVGSSLVAQDFSDPGSFHPRPSAAKYDGAASSGSNLGPTSKALIDRIGAAATRLSGENGGLPVPIDLVTTSGSGLDPDISPAGAYFQARRVAEARGLSVGAVRTLIGTQTQQRTLGILGEPRVNVLALNLALDSLSRATASAKSPVPGKPAASAVADEPKTRQ